MEEFCNTIKTLNYLLNNALNNKTLNFFVI